MIDHFSPTNGWRIFDPGKGLISQLLAPQSHFNFRKILASRFQFRVTGDSSSPLNQVVLDYLDNAAILARLNQKKADLPHFNPAKHGDFPGALISDPSDLLNGHFACVVVERENGPRHIVTVSLMHLGGGISMNLITDGSAHGNNY